MMSDGRLAILAEGLFASHHAKTAHGVIRYGQREVVAVIDSSLAVRTADQVVPFCMHPVPIVASLAEAASRGASALLVGVAPTGGRLDPTWRATLLEAIREGMNVEGGLHSLLADDPELREAASERGVSLRDLRAAPEDLGVPRHPGERPPDLRVVHTVGSDVVAGKKVAALELDRSPRIRVLRSVFVATGQTGIAISGWGIAVDHVISDYVSGAAERLVDEGARRGDLLFVEGQGAILHPAYSAVTLGLLHGCAPDAMVLAHIAGARGLRNYPELAIPRLEELIASYEALASHIRPARVAALALNTSGLDEPSARRAIAEVEESCGRPADDVARFGAGRLLNAVLAALGPEAA
jgi:uncharacterized NAD-dependent epimerase/dehydratase family protein